ncbi:MAG: acyloxyacyl hydrolase [Chitinophagaceae bacterium]
MLISVSMCAQGSEAIEVNFLAGKVIKHTPKFSAPVPDLSTALDVIWVKQTTGTEGWEQRRKFPIWGVGATLVHYGIDSIYGNAIGLYPFLQVPIIRGKSLEWTLRAGFGVGYVTRHYERAPVWDTLNNAIGSSVNNFSMFATDLRYRLNEHWSLQAGMSFCHLSNGAMKQPNLGINLTGAHIGFRYWLNGDRPKKTVRTLPKLPNRILLQARIGMAIEESGTTDGPLYKTFLGTLYASHRYAGKNKLLFGIDYSYHQGIYAFERNNEINIGSERENAWKAAVFVGHEWMFGRMSLITQVGVYVKQAVLKTDPYYEKIGYNYYLFKKERGTLKELSLSVLLKTHKSIAELIEYGVTVGF